MFKHHYSIETINKIKFEESKYVIDPNIIDLIQNIVTMVGDPEYNKTPVFRKRKYNKNKEVDENFKITEIKKKEGVEAVLNKIRTQLNKVSNKVKGEVYEVFKTTIFSFIDEIKKETIDEWDENKKVINKFIINVICKNAFFSEILTSLYKEIVNKYEMSLELDSVLMEKAVFYKDIEWFDPNEEYDKFCDNNKKNELLRGFVLFKIRLLQNNLQPSETVIGLLIKIIDDIHSFVNVENKKEIIEELSEYCNIIIQNAYKYLVLDNRWENIKNDVIKIKNYKVKNYKSVSNKMIFKFMDINDWINERE